MQLANLKLELLVVHNISINIAVAALPNYVNQTVRNKSKKCSSVCACVLQAAAEQVTNMLHGKLEAKGLLTVSKHERQQQKEAGRARNVELGRMRLANNAGTVHPASPADGGCNQKGTVDVKTYRLQGHYISYSGQYLTSQSLQAGCVHAHANWLIAAAAVCVGGTMTVTDAG